MTSSEAAACLTLVIDDWLVRFVVDGAAVAKGRPRATRCGIVYTPAKTRAYEAHGRLAAQAAMDGRPPLVGPVRIWVTIVLPIPRSWSARKRNAAVDAPVVTRPDTDNYIKSAFDICTGIVFTDDSQVWRVEAYKIYGLDPRLVVEVRAHS